jgi:cyanophycin synthetase
MALDYVLDSRRLTGASMVLAVPGAILEVAPPQALKTKLRVRWRHIMQQLLSDLGWASETIVAADQGASQILAISAPIDQLLVATHINEAAWELALAGGRFAQKQRYLELLEEALSQMAQTANPRLRALHSAARHHKVIGLLSESEYSLGEGESARIYPLDDLPLPNEVAWRAKRREIPIALVTGTNGKTTTVRLLAHLLRKVSPDVGFCSTDFVQIGAQVLQRDDYSGPTGARMVLRNARTTHAVLEVARGGMLRRGLQVIGANVAVVTNVADDHLGENGIYTLDQLAAAKFTVVRGLSAHAPIVVNADDLHCRSFARKLSNPIFWFALSKPTNTVLRSKVSRAGLVYVADQSIFVERANAEAICLLDVKDCPLTLGGGALFNVQNVLAAVAAALCLDVPIDKIKQGLQEFGAHPADNPGRANVYPVQGARIVLDYGHNPDGVRAVLQSLHALKFNRLLIGVGLPGDRSLEAARAVAAAVVSVHPDWVCIKEMPKYLRGRPLGEISGAIRRELSARKFSAKKQHYLQDDAQMLQYARDWLKPGDLAVLFVHENTDQLAAQLLADTDL